MLKFFNGIFTYIHNLSTGEEVLSDRRKFTYIFWSFALIHVASAVFFVLLGNTKIVVMNVLAIFLYFGLLSLAKKKHYLMVSLIAEIEVLVAIAFISFSYGSMLGYSLYCFAMIPTIFYITSTVKEMKHPTVYCFVFSFISMLTFFTIIVSEPFFTIPQIGGFLYFYDYILTALLVGNEIQQFPAASKKPAACGSGKKGSSNQACQPQKHDGTLKSVHAPFAVG